MTCKYRDIHPDNEILNRLRIGAHKDENTFPPGKLYMSTDNSRNTSNKSAEHRQDRHYMLYELFHSISSTLDTDVALNLIIDAAVHITGASSGSLVLVDWEKRLLNIAVYRGFVEPIEDTQLKVGEGITGWVAENGKALLVEDVSKDKRYVQLKADIRSELAVPLFIEDRLIGVVNVDSTRLNALDEEDLDLLTLLAKQSARVIDNGNLFDTVKRKVEELSTLIKVNKTIASTLSLNKTLREIVTQTARLMKTRICAIMLLSDDGETLLMKAHFGGGKQFEKITNLAINRHPLGEVIREQKTVIIPNVQQVTDYRFREITAAEGLDSLLAVPLTVRDKTIGLIKIYNDDTHRYTDEETNLLNTFADLCAVTIDNARLYDTMANLEEQTRRADRLAAVGELAVGIAHEIRNPLTVIKMIFESGSELNSKDRNVISEELTRMNTIITQLLDYTRPNEPAREFCKLNRIIENAIMFLSYQLDAKNIQLKSDLQKGMPKIFADPVQLQQIFLNIVLNSSEAMPDGGNIEISSKYDLDAGFEITLSDDGPGLPDIIAKNLFVPFTTTKVNGLGLGLSIIKRIIDGHQATINVNSNAGKGTSIQLVFPIGSQSLY